MASALDFDGFAALQENDGNEGSSPWDLNPLECLKPYPDHGRQVSTPVPISPVLDSTVVGIIAQAKSALPGWDLFSLYSDLIRIASLTMTGSLTTPGSQITTITPKLRKAGPPSVEILLYPTPFLAFGAIFASPCSRFSVGSSRNRVSSHGALPCGATRAQKYITSSSFLPLQGFNHSAFCRALTTSPLQTPEPSPLHSANNAVTARESEDRRR